MTWRLGRLGSWLGRTYDHYIRVYHGAAEFGLSPLEAIVVCDCVADASMRLVCRKLDIQLIDESSDRIPERHLLLVGAIVDGFTWQALFTPTRQHVAHWLVGKASDRRQ